MQNLSVLSGLSKSLVGGASGKEPASASAGDRRDVCSIPELGRSPGVRNGNPLQHS